MSNPADFVANELRNEAIVIGETYKRAADGEVWMVTAASAYGERQITRQSDGKQVVLMSRALAGAATGPDAPLKMLEYTQPTSLVITQPSTSTAWLDAENGTTTWHVRGVFDRG